MDVTPTKPSECQRTTETEEFTVWWTAFSHYLCYWVAERKYLCVNGDPNVVNYQTAGALYCPEPTADIDAAELLLHGSIKWDGCADFDVGDERDHPHRLHACGLDNARRVGRAIDLIYELAAKHIPAWSD